MRHLVPVLAAVPLLAGCRPGPEIVGSGAVVTETREVGEFHAVDLTGMGELVLAPGNSPRLEVEGEDNVLPLVRSDAEDGTLRLGFRPGTSVRPTRSLVFRLTARTLDAVAISGAGKVIAPGPLRVGRLELSVSGAGDLMLNGLTAESLALRLSGVGVVRLMGTAEELDVLAAGVADVRADGLKAKDVTVRLAGSGTVAVWATEALTADVSGAGAVRYKGDPRVTQAVAGTGSVRRDE